MLKRLFARLLFWRKKPTKPQIQLGELKLGFPRMRHPSASPVQGKFAAQMIINRRQDDSSAIDPVIAASIFSSMPDVSTSHRAHSSCDDSHRSHGGGHYSGSYDSSSDSSSTSSGSCD